MIFNVQSSSIVSQVGCWSPCLLFVIAWQFLHFVCDDWVDPLSSNLLHVKYVSYRWVLKYIGIICLEGCIFICILFCLWR